MSNQPPLAPVEAPIHLLGVPIHPLTQTQLLETIFAAIPARQRRIISYANVHTINLAQESDFFRAYLNQTADIVFCDGFGVKWGAKLAGLHIPERYTPPDWLATLCAGCVQRDHSLYFLGAKPTVADRAADTLRAQIPGLQIVGTHHGYFDKSPNSDENAAVLDAINAANPDVLVVGFGMPTQERWITDNHHRIDAPIILTVGAAFDYIAGETVRAPKWMTDNGLEWLGRLLIEPRRLWHRYLVGNPVFIYRVLKRHTFGR